MARLSSSAMGMKIQMRNNGQIQRLCISMRLEEEDVKIGVEKGTRSLIGRVFGEKKSNFLVMNNSMMKLWQYKGLNKVVSLNQNTFQFIFSKEENQEGIMKG